MARLNGRVAVAGATAFATGAALGWAWQLLTPPRPETARVQPSVAAVGPAGDQLPPPAAAQAG